MEITTEQIKDLRNRTGVSVMQCKKALEEAGGDMDKALVILQKNSKAQAEKKADRELKSGTIASYIHSTGTVGVLVELACETDFVGKNEEFKEIAYQIAMQVAAQNPQFLKKDDIDDESRRIAKEVFQEEVKDKPADMQEKILEGKLDAYFKDKVLLDQPYIKNPDLTIQGLLDAGVQKFGEKMEVVRFTRFAI